MLAATAVPRRKPWWLFATSALAFAGAAAILVVPQLQSRVVAFTVEAPWDKGAPAVRGASPNIGDLVHATVRGGTGYRAVWVYHDDQLVAACPGDPGCRVEVDRTIADVRLRAIGVYRIVALSSIVPVAPPRGSYDADVATARDAGAVIHPLALPVR